MTRHAPTNTTRIRRATRRGFTIVELLVAVSLLALMLFLIDNLFNSTTRAVSDGVRQSAVLANARAVQSRLTIDASAMLGPNANNPAPEGGGYLIIINKRIQSQVLRRDGSESLETFRSDQLVFMASTTAPTSNIRRFRSGTPRNANQFGSDFSSPYALIRYGHGRRVNRDGTDLGSETVTTTDDWVELGWNRSSKLDRLANDWILARQAVLFAPTDSLNNPIDTSNDWYTLAPFALADIENDPLGRAMVAGFCDVTDRPPSDTTTGFIDNFLVTGNAANPSLDAAARTANYLALTHANERLRLNPIPVSNVDANNDNVYDYNFEADIVGQLSGIFSPNCSEFMIQFAADVDGDGEVDRSDNGTPADTSDDFIIWYDMDNLAFLLGLNPEWNGATASEFNAPYFDISGSNHGDVAFVFRFNDDGTLSADETASGTGGPINSKWPYMIRIRYRLHDAPGRLESNASFRINDDVDQDVDGVDVPGGPPADFDNDEAIVSGRYFEQIIRVPRP